MSPTNQYQINNKKAIHRKMGKMFKALEKNSIQMVNKPYY